MGACTPSNNMHLERFQIERLFPEPTGGSLRDVDPLFADERWTAYGLFREAGRAVDAALLADVTSDLDDDVGSVLIQLVRSPDERLRMIDLARAMSLHPSHVTRLIDRCETLGVVARVRCESDRRVWWAMLTDEGRRQITAVAPSMLEALDRHYFSHLSARERVVVEKVMRRMRDAAQAAARVQQPA